MTPELHLQVGGTLNPRQHLYVERPEDDIFLRLLLEGQYVNILTSRQMGKSSLMMRAVHQLEEQGVRWVTIDLASELGSPPDLDAYYLGLLGKILRNLRLELDLRRWWTERDIDTVNQRLLRFFREVVGSSIVGQIIIFLDEIDSTLKLPYTDDLFTAIRGMYNERPIVEEYRRISFCLLGVATPNELIKNRRTTAYNIGTTLELRDFDNEVDDLSPLAAPLNLDPEKRAVLLARILHWSGGQPYLTQKFCLDVVEKAISDVAALDEHVARTFDNLDRASAADIHFQQILRFLEERLSDESATIELYSRILKSGYVPDRTTLTHAELKLSGLVKRDRNGNLVVRNPIYRRLFDNVWVAGTRPRRTLGKTRRFAIAASLAFLAVTSSAGVYYTTVVRPEQRRLAALDRLAQLKISITNARDGYGTRASFPNDGLTQDSLKEAISLLKVIGTVTEIGPSGFDELSLGQFSNSSVNDLSPLLELVELRGINVRGFKADLGPLAFFVGLEELSAGWLAGINPDALANAERLRVDGEFLAKLKLLKDLSLFNTTISDLRPLSSLTRLNYLNLGSSLVADLSPLAELTLLEQLYVWGTNVSDLRALSAIPSLRELGVSATQVSDLSPLSGLTQLEKLLVHRTRVTDIAPLRGLTKLKELYLSDTQISDVTPLAGLTELVELDLSNTRVSDLLPLMGLARLRSINLRGTNVSREQVRLLQQKLPSVRISMEQDPSDRLVNPEK